MVSRRPPSRGVADAGGIEQVLDVDRHAGQRADRLVAFEAGRSAAAASRAEVSVWWRNSSASAAIVRCDRESRRYSVGDSRPSRMRAATSVAGTREGMSFIVVTRRFADGAGDRCGRFGDEVTATSRPGRQPGAAATRHGNDPSHADNAARSCSHQAGSPARQFTFDTRHQPTPGSGRGTASSRVRV